MELFDALRELAQQYAGQTLPAPVPLKGDGSDRQIYRFHHGTTCWIGVTNAHVSENQAFFFLTKHLAQCGIPVPQLYCANREQTCYLLEDLGNQTLAQSLVSWQQTLAECKTTLLQAYAQVLHWLPKIHFVGHRGLDYQFCFREKELDRTVFQADLDYFKNSFWRVFATHYSLEKSVWNELQALLVQLEKVERTGLVLRDFQARNIMWREGAPCFIDYQMGCRGAIHYDLASLLYGSASGLNETLRAPLIEMFLQELTPWLSLNPATFLQDFYGFVLIRRLRSLGTYGFLTSQKGKGHFLEAIPPTIHEIYDLLASQAALHSFSHLKALFFQWKHDENLCHVPSLYNRLGVFR